MRRGRIEYHFILALCATFLILRWYFVLHSLSYTCTLCYSRSYYFCTLCCYCHSESHFIQSKARGAAPTQPIKQNIVQSNILLLTVLPRLVGFQVQKFNGHFKNVLTLLTVQIKGDGMGCVCTVEEDDTAEEGDMVEEAILVERAISVWDAM